MGMYECVPRCVCICVCAGECVYDMCGAPGGASQLKMSFICPDL